MNCTIIQPLLSEYIDNALSARDTWEVDKHLTDCNACALLLNEMRETVQALALAPRYEVSDDFMASLQSRLATLQPEPPRRAWFASLQEFLRPRRMHAWGAAAATCALAIIMLVPRLSPPIEPGPVPPPPPGIIQTAQHQSVSLAASNPLGDPAAAALISDASDAAESGEIVQ